MQQIEEFSIPRLALKPFLSQTTFCTASSLYTVPPMYIFSDKQITSTYASEEKKTELSAEGTAL